jgi:Na+/proline symporter
MSPTLLFSFVIGYFVILLIVAYYTSRNSNNDSFFIGNKNSNWMLVAFGMIGTSLSGVTFVSVPVLLENHLQAALKALLISRSLSVTSLATLPSLMFYYRFITASTLLNL